MATQTAFPVKTASQKQLDFIATLRTERVLSTLHETSYTRESSAGLTSKQASYWIGELLSAPRAAAAVPAVSPVSVALENVAVSKYAVPTWGIMIPELRTEGDLLFLEVRTFKGHKYLRRLHGSPGGFLRTRLTASQTIALAAVIEGKHVEYARLFGEHYSVCGRCGAELTDQKSREVFFGPECRKIFGV